MSLTLTVETDRGRTKFSHKVWIQEDKGGIDMGDKGGKKDKGKREQQKQAKLTTKEKRQAKNDKKK